VNQITLPACHQKAYASQRTTATDRAHRGQAKIKARLIGNLDPDEWDLPPKPKWMRWRTATTPMKTSSIGVSFHGATITLGTSAI
jgi:hypothetical protein